MKNKITLLFFCLSLLTVQAQQVTLEGLISGLTQPLDIQNAGDDRLFIVEKGGRIKISDLDGNVNPTPYLDVSGQISTTSERGLLGLAFHPDYANNGFFFVNYTQTNGDTRVSRFSVMPGNPDVADISSELIILEFEQPFETHNAGTLNFGPDGYLYIASGDGGSGGDPLNNAQDTSNLLGNILRIDVDNPSGGNNYGIPADNPFFGSTTEAPEIWAYGLRNPWKFSIDFVDNNIWIGDVGQGDVEEIDKQPLSAAGLNYGWRCYEGSAPFNTAGCPPQGDLTFPFHEYSSANGSGNCSVTGGYVYRGSVYSDIAGHYFFADLCGNKIFSLAPDNTLHTYSNSGNWVSFGQDVNKELYVVAFNGIVYKIKGGTLAVNEENTPAFAVTLYPNPAQNTVTLTLTKENITALELWDMQGKNLLTESNLNTSTKTLDTSFLANGIYFIKVIANNKHTIERLVVAR